MPAANYSANITAFEIYVGGEIAETVGPNDHEVLIENLVVGHTYSVHVIAVDSITGDSGPSYPVEVTI